jgi:hypothetical protein
MIKSSWEEDIMPGEKPNASEELKCPDCRAPLKRRRTRNADECEMLCGGCGQIFDVCDFETAELLKKQS